MVYDWNGPTSASATTDELMQLFAAKVVGGTEDLPAINLYIPNSSDKKIGHIRGFRCCDPNYPLDYACQLSFKVEGVSDINLAFIFPKVVQNNGVTGIFVQPCIPILLLSRKNLVSHVITFFFS